MMEKPLLCLDFDGVIHSYSSGWKGPRNIPDLPVPGALDFIVNSRTTFRLAIHSSRSRYWFGRHTMRQWLRKYLTGYWWEHVYAKNVEAAHSWGWTTMDLEEDARRWAAGVIHDIAFPLMKPPAFVTIDDRAITFAGEFPKPEELLSFKPWNHR